MQRPPRLIAAASQQLLLWLTDALLIFHYSRVSRRGRMSVHDDCLWHLLAAVQRPVIDNCLNSKLLLFRSSPQRWHNKPGKNVRPSVRTYVRPNVRQYVRTSTIKLNAATNQIVEFVRVDEKFTTIWLSRSSDVRVKVRRWPQSPIGTIIYITDNQWDPAAKSTIAQYTELDVKCD